MQCWRFCPQPDGEPSKVPRAVPRSIKARTDNIVFVRKRRHVGVTLVTIGLEPADVDLLDMHCFGEDNKAGDK